MQYKAQASIDMLISYGIAILIVTIALYVVLQLGLFNTQLAPSYCESSSYFVCSEAAITPSGNLTIIFSQSTGGTINITGIACASEPNSTINGPKYGNFHVLPYKKASQYYPDSMLANGLMVYPSGTATASVNCYAGGGIAKGGVGNAYSGYVWINYTISALPTTYHSVQQVILFSEKYS